MTQADGSEATLTVEQVMTEHLTALHYAMLDQPRVR